MTQKEIKRLEVLVKVDEKRLRQSEAAIELNLSLRQLQRLYKSFRKEGAPALASKKRGKPSNNHLPRMLVAQIGEIVTSERYDGFRPTLMTEKLEELHGITVSRETVRQLMIQNDVWDAKKEKRFVLHQQRKRRARFGELVQIDGSPHAWFEDRGEPCTLIVFIDDATNRTYGKFFDSETTAGYMQTTEEYIKRYGKPRAYYSDKYSVFRVNNGDDTKRERFTQFGKALHELDIQLIYANSPQAKGRVERANQTLQDRLVKEMRLKGINTIQEANKFLERFWDDYNKKFAIPAACQEDAHRKLDETVDLSRVLCEKHERVISKNLEFNFETVIYQITLKQPCRSLKGSKVVILKHPDGRLDFEYKGTPLPAREFVAQRCSGPELDRKELNVNFKKLRGDHKVPAHHPWKQAARAAVRFATYKHKHSD